MNRIPTEGLKLREEPWPGSHNESLNEQNPDRGIETVARGWLGDNGARGLNEQNPDRGIETPPLPPPPGGTGRLE